MANILKFSPLIGLTTVGGYYLYSTSIQSNNKFTRMPFCGQTIDLVNGYKPAVEKLGEPIKLSKIDEKDEFNFMDARSARVKMEVDGKKRSAIVFMNASRGETDRNWNIDSLEIKYKGSINQYKIYDRSLIIKNNVN